MCSLVGVKVKRLVEGIVKSNNLLFCNLGIECAH
jgi:hypothetical protein